MSDPYASHLPILVALCDILQPKRVLEFGGGMFSTDMLATHSAVKELVTFEPSQEWRTRLREAYPHVAVQIFIDWKTFDRWDLIMIDDGQNAEERIARIEQVADAKPTCPVVIHDFEVYEDTAMRLFEHGIRIDLLNPATGVVWNGDALTEEQIERLKDALRIN